MKRSMSLNPEDYLQHIQDEIEILLELKKKISEKEFYKDEFLKRTAVRCFEIIGEAVKNLPNEIKDIDSQINWKDMAGMRDVMIHNYFDVDYEIVWKTINDDIPPLRRKIKNLKKKLKNG